MRKIIIWVFILTCSMCVCAADETSVNPLEDLASKMGELVMVEMDTSHGKIEIALFKDKAPGTVKNFTRYIEDGFYNDTVFHRVIKGFMIQGGGMTADLSVKDTYEPIKNEATNGLKNETGTIAMARTNVVDSATCQFFINVVDNARLDHVNDTVNKYGYAVFGKVVQGMDVVHAIENVPVDNRFQDSEQKRIMMRHVPVEPVIIKSVKIVNPEKK